MKVFRPYKTAAAACKRTALLRQCFPMCTFHVRAAKQGGFVAVAVSPDKVTHAHGASDSYRSGEEALALFNFSERP